MAHSTNTIAGQFILFMQFFTEAGEACHDGEVINHDSLQENQFKVHIDSINPSNVN